MKNMVYATEVHPVEELNAHIQEATNRKNIQGVFKIHTRNNFKTDVALAFG